MNVHTSPVRFSWSSNDGGVSGSMFTTLLTSTYAGNFVQITHETTHAAMAPMWLGWIEDWGDWPCLNSSEDPERWSAYYLASFTCDYEARVIANLVNDAGQRMRCRFQLNNPKVGIAGGAQGECQLSNGATASAVLDRAVELHAILPYPAS